MKIRRAKQPMSNIGSSPNGLKERNLIGTYVVMCPISIRSSITITGVTSQSGSGWWLPSAW